MLGHTYISDLQEVWGTPRHFNRGFGRESSKSFVFWKNVLTRKRSDIFRDVVVLGL